MKNKKLFYFLFFFLIIGCTKQVFKETQWREINNKLKTEDLYKSNYKDGYYFNPWNPMEEKGLLNVIQWKLTSGQLYTDQEKKFKAKISKDSFKKIIKLKKDVNFILWIGHNSFLVRIDNQYWLTDPIFSDRALLPKRLTSPGISIDDINKLAGSFNIIITHNHYDHLDSDSIKNLNNNSKVFVPLGLKEYILDLNKKYVQEMDWWQEIIIDKETRLICLPAQHWSRRITQGTNKTLWASFLLVTKKYKIYFGGDSGYFHGYREFGKKYKNINYAFMPITAYHPRWFMHYAHMNIEESLRAFDELGASYFIPTQWGTFKLGDEPDGYPLLDLRRYIKNKNLNPKKFLIMNIGEVIEMK